MTVRISMESMRDIDRVVGSIGKITMSKARGLVEQIAFDGLRLEDVDPANLGKSDTERIAWLVGRAGAPMRAADVAKALGISDDTAAVALCRLVSRRRLAKAPLGYSSRARE